MGLFDFVGDAVSDVGNWVGGAGEDILGFVGDRTGFDQDPRRLDKEAREARQDLYKLYDDVVQPTVNDLAGDISYNYENPFRNLESDQGSIDAQMQALRGLQEMGQQGFTSAEMGMMQAAQRQAAQAERAQRQAVLQQMAARGMRNSGAGLAGALAAQQGGANRLVDSQAQLQMGAQQRALQGLQASGGLASQMRGQADNMSRFRATSLDRFNQMNTDRRNLQAQRTADARQQAFNNQMNVLGRKGGLYGAQAQDLQNQATTARNRQDAFISGTKQYLEDGVKGIVSMGAGGAPMGGSGGGSGIPGIGS